MTYNTIHKNINQYSDSEIIKGYSALKKLPKDYKNNYFDALHDNTLSISFISLQL